MKKNNSNVLALGALIFFAGAVLLASPRCQGNCRTVGEHFMTHGLKAIFGFGTL